MKYPLLCQPSGMAIHTRGERAERSSSLGTAEMEEGTYGKCRKCSRSVLVRCFPQGAHAGTGKWQPLEKKVMSRKCVALEAVECRPGRSLPREGTPIGTGRPEGHP